MTMPITPTEIDRAIRAVIPEGESVDTLSVIMLGPDNVEVKARLAVNHQWYQGIVNRIHWQDAVPE